MLFNHVNGKCQIIVKLAEIAVRIFEIEPHMRYYCGVLWSL